MTTLQFNNNRILTVDDAEAIHEDFRKTLTPVGGGAIHAGLDEQEALLFGDAPTRLTVPTFALTSALQGEYAARLVADAVAANNPFALAFVDMRMPPGWDGLETIEHLWSIDPELQTVICTAYADYNWTQIIQRLGVNDRLLILKKPFDTVEVLQLATAMTMKWNLARQAKQRVEELEEMVERRTADLRRLALHDRLTGLPNRVLLTDRLEHACRRREREPDYRFAVLFLDFDGFKAVNDTHGHEVGDMLLVRIAERIREALRGIDTASRPGPENLPARLGGDEFIILLEHLHGPDDALAVAERLLATLARPYDIAGHSLVSTASIGVATSDHGEVTPDAMLRRADNAMYRAKQLGKARAHLDTPEKGV